MARKKTCTNEEANNKDQSVRETIELSPQREFIQEGEIWESTQGSAWKALRGRAEERQLHAKQLCPRTPREDGDKPLATTPTTTMLK